ncbi:hypothetical protein F511_18910 [Dorcoceras hygrometricum]|uniref:hAT-like transposase RNase-H fold domain-containing protein n=1 Tax=Dorcoceras hygrometricum TaxID=472368 RepID=A0A2Z7CB17_9LAMI|nr:hypothetical protein F511_18910 [Dorcoceras hygrometricum]
MSDSVVKIRNTVRYVRSSPARFKKFKTASKMEVTSLFVTSNQYFHELCLIKNVIKNYTTEKDPLLSRMTKGMESKFNKYWGDFEKINSLLFVAIIHDPRYKLKFIKYYLSHFDEKDC